MHPARGCALWVASVHTQAVVQPPVVVALEEEHLPIGPGEGCVRAGGDPAKEHGEGLGVVGQVVVLQLVPLPELGTLQGGTGKERPSITLYVTDRETVVLHSV